MLGRGSEEVLACHRAGVRVEVIPGVTSAISVPGAAGIPLTHRGVSHLFTVVSGHAPLTDAELEHLAGLGGTIVVLMGVNSLPSLTAGLARFGMSADDAGGDRRTRLPAPTSARRSATSPTSCSPPDAPG